MIENEVQPGLWAEPHFLQFKNMPFVGVDDGRISPLEDTGPSVVGHVNMAMDEIARLILVNQIQQTLKSLMCPVAVVSVSKGRGVGDNNVYTSGTPQLKAQLPNAPCHLPLAVLMGAAVVKKTAAQTEDAQAFDGEQLVLNAIAALRRILFIAPVMISVDVQQRSAAHGNQKAEITGVQIAAGENQVDPIQTAGLVVIPEGRTFFVGKKQDLHSRRPSFSGKI